MTSPFVTISILVYGPSPWFPQVVDALARNTTLPYELVIVDNGTNDETRAFIADIDGARVLTPGRNLGFGVGHNAAANIARGEYLCTLNSDAIVPPGWLDALVAPLAAEPAAGAAAPVYVYPDGRLQEAGATVEPSGQVIAFGRFDDPTKDEYRLAGRVPFASAACLVTRTATFRELGGFDARYGLAYYEDVDFAFALLARGLHVELVAGVRVVHAQGASSDTRSDAEQLLLGNRERFRERWAHFLTGRPYVYARPEAHHLAAARDYDACDRLLLVLDEPSAFHTFVAACHAALHAGRVTIATPECSNAQRDVWLARGVEVVALNDLDAMLSARRFHFAAIVVAPALHTAHTALAAKLHDTQPQAVVVALPSHAVAMDSSSLERWIGSLDLVPTLPIALTGAQS